MIDRDKVLKELEALDKAMSRNQCYTCSHEFIDAVEEFGTNIIVNAIDMLKYDELERLQFIEATAKLVAENEMLKKDNLAKSVIRCKDCAYAIFKEGVTQHGYMVCTKPFTERWQVVKPGDWFCADAKRKDG